MVVVAFLLVACGPAFQGTAATTPGVTDDPAVASCAADVVHANLNVHDVGALDFAIHDCGSLAMLRAAIDRNPGYLNPSMTTLEEFAGNRCEYSLQPLASAPICRELGRHP